MKLYNEDLHLKIFKENILKMFKFTFVEMVQIGSKLHSFICLILTSNLTNFILKKQNTYEISN